MNWLSRALRWVPWAAATVMVLAIVVWLTGPYVVSSVGAKKLSQLLGRPVTMGDVRIEPWDIAVSIENLQVARAAGDAMPGPQFGIGHLRVNLDVRGLLQGAPVIESLDVVDPVLSIARIAPGRFDIDDVIGRLTAPPQEPKPAGELLRWALFNVKLHGGRIDIDDRPVGRKHAVRDIDLALPFLSNLPADVDVTVQPRLAFTLDGTRLESGAQTTPFAIHRSSEMTLKLGDVNLGEWAAYWPARLPLRPQKGFVSADLVLQFFRAPKGSTHFSLRGSVRSRDVSLTDANGAALADWRAAELVLADVRPLEQVVRLERLQVDAPVLALARDTNGVLNLQKLAGGTPTPAPVPPAAASGVASSPAVAGEAPAPWEAEVRRIEIAGGLVRWSDEATKPAAAYELHNLQIGVDEARWPLTAPIAWKVDARLSASGHDAGTFAASGQAGHELVQADVTVEQLTLGALDPYLQTVLRHRVEGQASTKLQWRMAQPFGEALQQLDLASLVVTEARLTSRGAAPRKGAPPPEALPSIGRVEVAGARIDLAQRSAAIARVALNEVDVSVARDTKGELNVSGWLADAGANGGAKPKAAQSGKPWSVKLSELALDGGRVRWRDQAQPIPVARTVAIGLDAMRLSAKNLVWPGTSPSDVEFSARMRPVSDLERGERQRKDRTRAEDRGPGRIEWVGSITPQPLAARGRLIADRVPLQAIEPYLHATVPVDIVRVDAGFRGTLDVRSAPAGLQGRADGDALLTDLRVLARGSGEELLTWQSLKLPAIRAQWQPGVPPSLQTGEGVLTDFYASLVITEAGRLNLTDARTAQATDPAAAPAGNETNAAPPRDALALGPQSSGSAPPAASAPATTATEAGARESTAVQLALGGLQLVNGKIDFTDHFVRPNYSAALTELNGRIGSFRSGTSDMAPIELRGRAAGTALLDVRGAVNPVAKPLALEIRARASDLELAPLSPYAGKYVGYAIERGKLTMDVQYTIKPDGTLSASNQIILNQLTFGDKVESPNATSLPVKLAVALLKDSNGVIDLNLPISGSLNDPQFSFGGLILKVLGNLLVKAVTAPFSFLTGGGEEASRVDFVPGTATLAPSAAETITRIGKALLDRPNLQLTIAGAADPVSEREAIQQAAVDARVQAAARSEKLRAGQQAPAPASAPSAALPASAPAPVTVGAAERERYVREVYDDTKLENKPRNVLGFAKRIPVAEMEALLRQGTLVSNDSARDLALKRGIAVRDALLAQGLKSDRIFLAAPNVRGSGEDDAKWTPSVELALAPQ